VWRTARAHTGSIVKRVRSQSHEQPMACCCVTMRVWHCSFHAQMRSMSASRPMSWRVLPSISLRRFSTTDCVAMPAWSVPAIHKVLSPCMRCQRMRRSCITLSIAWPMCSAPVTLGSGIMTT